MYILIYLDISRFFRKLTFLLFVEMADNIHECEQMGGNGISHEEQDSCPKNLTPENCKSCAYTQENKRFICLLQGAKEENMVDRPGEVQKSSPEIPKSDNGHQKEPSDSISDDFKEMKMTDESKDVSKPCSENFESVNFDRDKEKAEETEMDQWTENQQRNELNIGADRGTQLFSEKESTAKKVSNTRTSASNSNLDNKSQLAGNSSVTQDMGKSDGGNERYSQIVKIDNYGNSENVGESKEFNDVCQSNSVTDNQKQCSGTNQSGINSRETDRDSMPTNEGWTEVPVHASKHKYYSRGHSKKIKKNKKIKWTKLDLNQEVKSSDLKEPQQAGSYDQRNSMEDKKYHDGGHPNPQDRRGHRNHKPENRVEQMKENTGKHSHTPKDQRLYSGKQDEWPSLTGKNSTQNDDWGNQNNVKSRENDRDDGKPKHGRDSREVHASKHRQNPDHQRQHGHHERSFATERFSANERPFTQVRNSTEDEEYSNTENQSDVNGRESDREGKPANEGGWTEVRVHAPKHKSKPGIQRQYGGNGKERPPRRDRKNRWKENEKDNAYQWEKNSEKENKEWVHGERKKNSGGEKKHYSYPDESHKYEYFLRNHSVYSQWYLSDFEVDGIKFNCAEKYMMYHKAGTKCTLFCSLIFAHLSCSVYLLLYCKILKLFVLSGTTWSHFPKVGTNYHIMKSDLSSTLQSQ